MADVTLTYTLNNISEAWTAQAMLKGGKVYKKSICWMCDSPDLERLLTELEVLFYHDTSSSLETVVFLRGGGLAHIWLSGINVNVEAIGNSYEHCSLICREVATYFPRLQLQGRERTINFWTYADHGARCFSRVITVPTWEDVKLNYPPDVMDHLQILLDFRPKDSDAGRLLLLRGEPGTGKTWAIRTLIQAWSWADFQYITDPDKFFGFNPDYMLKVLLDEKEDQTTWRVLLLEDAGELISKDARSQTGQGLSRLLNLVDGLIGQGLRILCLITTNEELKSLHPAIVRPGRCLANIKFRPFTPEEAQEWLNIHGYEKDIENGLSLAELYAVLEDRSVQLNTIGFRS
jgi:hypothetical protein